MMCRLAAYLGPAATLQSLFVDPPHSLYHQAYAPRDQVSGTINADGFGVGWFDLDRRAEPAVHKSARSMWADRSFQSFGGIVTSAASVAVVRGATAPAPVEDSGAQPFSSDGWLFAHNGAIDGFRTEGVAARLRRSLSDRRSSEILSASDSEVVFAHVLDRLDAGSPLDEAVVGTIEHITSMTGGRLNLLITDGQRIIATRWGDALSSLVAPGVIHIASEPFDDDPAWDAIPDHHMLDATVDARTLTAIP